MANILQFDSVTSTNDVAAEETRNGAAHLSVITANIQTNGRGRLGRIWQTFPECGLAMSVVVRAEVKLLPLVASIIVHKALANVLGEKVAIKWPNDILGQTPRGRFKLGGILIESYPEPNQPGKRFYIVGIGLNINTPPEGLPEDLAATTLQELAGAPLQKMDILQEIMAEFHKSLDLQAQTGNGHLIEYYRKHCVTLGQDVRWVDSGKEVFGKAVDINDDGNLLLNVEGNLVVCTTGDVIHEMDE